MMMQRSISMFCLLSTLIAVIFGSTHAALRNNHEENQVRSSRRNLRYTDSPEVSAKAGTPSSVHNVGNSTGPPPATVDELDASKYVGLWYQVYASLIPNVTFEKNGYCVTAFYSLATSQSTPTKTVINVANSQTLYQPQGALDVIYGYAVNNNTINEPGQYDVYFPPSNFPGPYWIVELGPVNTYNGLSQYSYSIISAPFSTDLFVIVRDVAQFRSVYQTEVLAKLKTMGFDKPYNAPLETYQGSNCVYAPTSAYAPAMWKQ